MNVTAVVASHKLESLLYITKNNDGNTVLFFSNGEVVKYYYDLDFFIELFLREFYTDFKRNRKIVSDFLGNIYNPPIILSFLESFSLIKIKDQKELKAYLVAKNICSVKRNGQYQSVVTFYEGTKLVFDSNIRNLKKAINANIEFWNNFNQRISEIYQPSNFERDITMIKEEIGKYE